MRGGKSEKRMFVVQFKMIELQITQHLIISTKEGVGRFVSWLMSVYSNSDKPIS